MSMDGALISLCDKGVDGQGWNYFPSNESLVTKMGSL